jgi:hypothetical protein
MILEKKTMDLYVKPLRVKYNFHTYDPMGLIVCWKFQQNILQNTLIQNRIVKCTHLWIHLKFSKTIFPLIAIFGTIFLKCHAFFCKVIMISISSYTNSIWVSLLPTQMLECIYLLPMHITLDNKQKPISFKLLKEAFILVVT